MGNESSNTPKLDWKWWCSEPPKICVTLFARIIHVFRRRISPFQELRDPLSLRLSNPNLPIDIIENSPKTSACRSKSVTPAEILAVIMEESLEVCS